MSFQRSIHATCFPVALILALAGAVCAQPGPACPGPGFAPPVSLPVPARPTSIATADFNLDGNPDLAVTSEGTFAVQLTTVSVHLGNGAGGFAAPVNLVVGQRPDSVAASDLNLDGKPDLVVANRFSSDVSVLLGDGLGGFAAAVSFPTGVGPRSVVVGDFDADGNPDLATANFGIEPVPGTTVSVLIGDGLGGFGPPVDYATGTTPLVVVTSDFDSDGDLDLVTSNFFGNTVTLMLGDGLGGFGSPATIFAAATTTTHVAIGDLDLDGNTDLLVSDSGLSAQAPGATVFVLMGDGLGGFSPAAGFATGSGPLVAVVDDFDLDGRPDVATCNAWSGDVSVLVGDGQGGLALPVSFGVLAGAFSAAVADFDQDGSPDLAAANFLSNDVTLLMNTCTRIRLVASQDGGPGSPVFLRNHHLIPGHEYFNVFSLEPCATGVGSGPFLGLCASAPAAVDLLVAQVLVPVGTAPFHFVATSESTSFGPFPLPPLVIEGICIDFTGGTLDAVSGVSRLIVQ